MCIFFLLLRAFVHLSLMNTFFDIQALELQIWIYPLAAGLAVFVIVELEKMNSQQINAQSIEGSKITHPLFPLFWGESSECCF